MSLLKRKKAVQKEHKVISFAGDVTSMSVEEHSSQIITDQNERAKQIESLSKIENICTIHGMMAKLLTKEAYQTYENKALHLVELFIHDDSRWPDRKILIRKAFMEILKTIIPDLKKETKNMFCPECKAEIDVSLTECSLCGRVVAGVPVFAETANDDKAVSITHCDEKHKAFVERLNAFCRKNAASANLTDEILMEIRNHIEREDSSYRHEDVMKRPLVNGERPGTSVNMLIDAISGIKNPKLYSHLELICQKLWGWEFPVIDDALFRFIEDVYLQLREAMSSIPAEESILVHQNNMLFVTLSLAFKAKGIKYVVKRCNFKVPRDSRKQTECDRYFAKVIEKTSFPPIELF